MRRKAEESRGDPLGMFVDPVTGFVGLMFLVVVVLMLVIPKPTRLRIPAVTPPPAGAGLWYQFTIPTQGGFGDRTFSCPAGSLPKGLQLDPRTGVISGVPEPVSGPNWPVLMGAVGPGLLALVAGPLAALTEPSGPAVFTARVTVIDEARPRQSTARDFTFVVTPYAIPASPEDTRVRLLQGAGPLPQARVNVPYEGVVGARGGLGRVQWSQRGLPDELRMDGGRIAGIPSRAGVTQITVRGEFKGGTATVGGRALTWRGGSDEREYDLQVMPPLQAAELPTARSGRPWRAHLFSSTLRPGEMTTLEDHPDWLQCDPNGLLTGTPPKEGLAGFSYQVRAATTEVIGKTRAELRVLPPLPAPGSPGLVISGRVGERIQAAIPYQGLVEPVTAASAHSLPADLQWAGAGIKGMSTKPGLDSLPVTLTDAIGTTVATTLAVRVLPAKEQFQIATPDTLHLVVGVPYSWRLPTTGGEARGVVALKGSPPPGLKVEDGIFSALVKTPGEWTLRLDATDPVTGELVGRDLIVRAGTTPPPPEPLRVFTKSLPTALVGDETAYYLAASGAEGPVTWRVDGKLPDGLRLENGVLWAKPAAEQKSRLTVTVTDTHRTSAPQVLDLSAERPERTTPIVTTMVLPPAIPGEKYAADLAAEGGLGRYTWETEGKLPAKMELKTSGRLEGVPVLAEYGSWFVRVRAVDERGTKSPVRELRLDVRHVIVPKDFKIRTRALPRAVVGSNFEVALAAEGASGPVTWTVTGLPAQMRVDSDHLKGAPVQEGSFPITLSCTDSLGRTATPVEAVFEAVRVNRNKPVIICRELPLGIPGQPYRVYLAAEGGVGGYKWQIDNLPMGVTVVKDHLRGDGQVVPGVYPIQAKVQDDRGVASDTVPLVLKVVNPEPFRVVTQTLPPAEVGQLYKAELSTAGGVGRIKWTHGILPLGLSLDGGHIQGTPTIAESKDVTVSAVDSLGQKTPSTDLRLRVTESTPIAEDRMLRAVCFIVAALFVGAVIGYLFRGRR